jgi:hypothetical protein
MLYFKDTNLECHKSLKCFELPPLCTNEDHPIVHTCGLGRVHASDIEVVDYPRKELDGDSSGPKFCIVGSARHVFCVNLQSE